MLDLSKSMEFLDPSKYTEKIHIIGCGSVGSTIAELLARFGFTKFCLYDFDKVEAHNLANQMFIQDDIGKLKTECVKKHILEINPDISNTIQIYNEGWNGHKLSGFVFLCVDNIDLRRKIVNDNIMNTFIKAMFDVRTRLLDAQHYAADWSNREQITKLLNTMQFTHEEANEETPMSACHVALSVAPTIRNICSCAVANFVNFLLGKQLKTMILMNSFEFFLTYI